MIHLGEKWRENMKKKLKISVRSVVAGVLILFMLGIGTGYALVNYFGVTSYTEDTDSPNVEKVYEKSNEVVISDIKPKRDGK